MKKSNKKIVLSTAAVLGVAALAAGGTIAYFTDKKETTNRFTVGDVKISLYESQLHRQNSGRGGNFPSLASDPDYCDWTANVQTTIGDSTLISGSYEKARYCTPNHDISANSGAGISAVVNGHTKASRNWGYTDEEIVTDAAAYKAVDDPTTVEDESGYFTRVKDNIAPGQWIRKFTYVKNEDESSDAYILIRYMVPTEYADKLDIKIPGTPYEEDTSDAAGHQGYFTALTRQLKSGSTTDYEYVAVDSSAKDSMDSYTGYVETIDNVEYRVYAAVTTDVVKPGEMTYWSPVNTVRLKTTVTTNDFDYGDAVDVKVDAQAIQAKTFSSAIDAIKNLE